MVGGSGSVKRQLALGGDPSDGPVGDRASDPREPNARADAHDRVSAPLLRHSRPYGPLRPGEQAGGHGSPGRSCCGAFTRLLAALLKGLDRAPAGGLSPSPRENSESHARRAHRRGRVVRALSIRERPPNPSRQRRVAAGRRCATSRGRRMPGRSSASCQRWPTVRLVTKRRARRACRTTGERTRPRSDLHTDLAPGDGCVRSLAESDDRPALSRGRGGRWSRR